MTSAEGFVVSGMSTSLDVRMCNTHLEEQKEILLCLFLLSIPRIALLPEPAARLAPSLRHTAHY